MQVGVKCKWLKVVHLCLLSSGEGLGYFYRCVVRWKVLLGRGGGVSDIDGYG